MPNDHLPSRADIQAARKALTNLSERVEILAKKFDGLRGAVRNINRLGTLLLVMALVLGGVAWYFIDQNRDSAIADCEAGNSRIARERAWWKEFFEVSVQGASQQKQPQAVLDYYAALREWRLNNLLPYRDCTDLDAPLPGIEDGPDYRDALKEAIRRERRESTPPSEDRR